jgi:hypothetical protein
LSHWERKSRGGDTHATSLGMTSSPRQLNSAPPRRPRLPDETYSVGVRMCTNFAAGWKRLQEVRVRRAYARLGSSLSVACKVCLESAPPGTPPSLRAELVTLMSGNRHLNATVRRARTASKRLRCGLPVCASPPYPGSPSSRAHHVRVPLQRGVPAQVPGPAAIQADERAATVVAGELAVCRKG